MLSKTFTTIGTASLTLLTTAFGDVSCSNGIKITCPGESYAGTSVYSDGVIACCFGVDHKMLANGSYALVPNNDTTSSVCECHTRKRSAKDIHCGHETPLYQPIGPAIVENGARPWTMQTIGERIVKCYEHKIVYEMSKADKNKYEEGEKAKKKDITMYGPPEPKGIHAAQKDI